MTNTQLLDEEIEKSGLRVGFIVDTLGLSRNGFDKKKKNKTKFRASEIFVLRTLLNLDKEKEQAIFYADKV